MGEAYVETDKRQCQPHTIFDSNQAKFRLCPNSTDLDKNRTKAHAAATRDNLGHSIHRSGSLWIRSAPCFLSNFGSLDRRIRSIDPRYLSQQKSLGRGLPLFVPPVIRRSRILRGQQLMRIRDQAHPRLAVRAFPKPALALDAPESDRSGVCRSKDSDSGIHMTNLTPSFGR